MSVPFIIKTDKNVKKCLLYGRIKGIVVAQIACGDALAVGWLEEGIGADVDVSLLVVVEGEFDGAVPAAELVLHRAVASLGELCGTALGVSGTGGRPLEIHTKDGDGFVQTGGGGAVVARVTESGHMNVMLIEEVYASDGVNADAERSRLVRLLNATLSLIAIEGEAVDVVKRG